MSDRLIVEPGARPWQPSSEAELVEVYNRYNMPLSGVIRQAGHHFVFHCMLGFADQVNLWGYALLEDQDIKELEEAGEEVTGMIGAIFVDRLMTLALATEVNGITFWVSPSRAPTVPPINDSPEGASAVASLVGDLLEQYRQLRESTDEAVSGLRGEVEGLVPA